jgi:hypothetical protein
LRHLELEELGELPLLCSLRRCCLAQHRQRQVLLPQLQVLHQQRHRPSVPLERLRQQGQLLEQVRLQQQALLLEQERLRQRPLCSRYQERAFRPEQGRNLGR